MREQITITKEQLKRAGYIGSGALLALTVAAGAITDVRGWRSDIVNKTPFGSHDTKSRPSGTETSSADPTYATPDECFDAAKAMLTNKGLNTESLEDWGNLAYAPIQENRSRVPDSVSKILKTKWGTDLGLQGSTTMDEVKTKFTNSGKFVDVTDYFSKDVNKQCIPNGVIIVYRDEGLTEAVYTATSLGKTDSQQYQKRATIAGTDVVNGSTGGIADSAKLQSIFAFAPK